jgi:hypothetical protein
METLTPLERVLVIAVGLTLTALFAVYVLPWAGQDISDRWLPTPTPVLATATPQPTATSTVPAPTATPTATLTPSPTPTTEPQS